MEKKQFEVTGMTCAACSARVEKCVARLEGVQTVLVNLPANSMTACFDKRKTDTAVIEQAVRNAGYEIRLQTDSHATTRALEGVRREQNDLRRRCRWSLAFLLPLLYVAMGHMMHCPLPPFLTGEQHAPVSALCQLGLLLPIMMLNNKYYRVGFKRLFRANPNMDSLVAMGSFAAFVYGLYAVVCIVRSCAEGEWEIVSHFADKLYFESAGTILTLVTLGKYLESKSKGKTSEALTRLVDLAPSMATLVCFGMEKEVPVSELQAGDMVRVKPGGRIPADGVVVQGSGLIDESALTGESLPAPAA